MARGKQYWIAAALSLVAASSPALAADQFDLTCRGSTEHTSVLKDPAKWVEGFDMELRIDLAAGKYCSGECNGRADIYEITDTRIEFSEPFERDRVQGTKAFYVDRTTGELNMYWFSSDRLLAFVTEAVCEVAPFKGIPETERKF